MRTTNVLRICKDHLIFHVGSPADYLFKKLVSRPGVYDTNLWNISRYYDKINNYYSKYIYGYLFQMLTVHSKITYPDCLALVNFLLQLNAWLWFYPSVIVKLQREMN